VNSLLAFERRQKSLQNTLSEIFRTGAPSAPEKRLAAELAYGSCRVLISLDHIISRHSARPIRKLDAVVRQILRVGLYQLLYLSRTPHFAAVHEAVQQAKACGRKGADGFINAVLRSIQRDIEGPITTGQSFRPRSVFWLDEKNGWQFKDNFLPDPNKNPAKYYSLAYGHPLWLVERWLKRYNEKTVRHLCLTNNSRPLLSLRANRLQCSAHELQERLEDSGWRVALHQETIYVLQAAMPEQLPGYSQGWFSVQDITATKATAMLEPKPGERILDMCAAPGGKTTHLAELMANEGCIIACDVRPQKLRLIEENCMRLGISIVKTCLAGDLPKLSKEQGPFDRILVDAPCSNTGVLARRVEVRHRLKPVHIPQLRTKQKELLRKAGKMVKKGGTILYSTCSIEPAENDKLVQEFLQESYSFRLLEQKTFLPDKSLPDTGGEFPDSSGENMQATGQEKVISSELWCDGGYTAVLQNEK